MRNTPSDGAVTGTGWTTRPCRLSLLVAGCTLAAMAASTRVDAQTAAYFYTVTPCRIVDTRDAAGPFGAPAIPPLGARSFTVAGQCGLPTTAQAVAVNVTVVAPLAAGHLLVYGAGIAQPLASTLNFKAASTRANNAIVGLGSAGAIVVYSGMAGAAVDVLLDIVGYFDAPPDPAVVAPPVFVPPPASYGGAQQVQIATSTAGSTIRYTTDGSPPSATTGQVYTAAVALASTTTLRAIALHDGLTDSAITTGAYTIAGAPTLYLAQLLPEGGAVSAGSGVSALFLAADEASATLTFSGSNLSGPLIAVHTHGPADPGQNGQILFDLDDEPQADGSHLWVFAQVGTTTPADIVAALESGRIYINLHTANYPAGEIRGHYNRATGSTTFNPPPPPPPLPSGPLTPEDASRFLTQATYGPKMSEIVALQTLGGTDWEAGLDSWLSTQFSKPLVSHLAYLDAVRASGQEVSVNHVMEAIWQQALAGDDLLRARVALALSEILVISAENGILSNVPDTLAGYMDILNRDAFGNFRTLLEDVTRSTGMSIYLDMLANDKPNPLTGQNPNENYAREILQLFSIGLYRLHPDGTLVLDQNGLPIATYDQDVVVGFAHVFTGWSFGGRDTNNPNTFCIHCGPIDYTLPLEAWPSHHSTEQKRLLDGLVIPQSTVGDPVGDLDVALDNIFDHPNTGPFLARGLIQRLVTSNPSPGYIYRVASVFADNGAGVRGDLQAVLRAIFLDYEARSVALLSHQGYGKLREPIVRFGGLLRAFDAAAPSGVYKLWFLDSPEYQLAQNPLRAPTVFNFFEPGYSLPGEVAAAGLDSPEFQITTETSAIGSANFIANAIFRGVGQGGLQDRIVLDISSLLAQPTDAALVDHLDLLLMGGNMSPAMRTILIDTLADLPPNPADRRVRTLLRLVATAPEFVVQK